MCVLTVSPTRLTFLFLTSCCFMLTPELCREPKHKEAASLLIIVSTLVSLGAASTAGLGITSSVTAGI